MKRYNNYHKHTHYSNLSTLDSCSKPIDYINRAKELGQNSYFTTEHGWQGNIFEAFKLCKDANLKPIYGVEAYYVDDSSIKESRANYHIVLIAMTNKGRKQINKIISRAQTDGFYYKARIDLKDLLTLHADDVVITSACVATRMFIGDDWKEKFFNPIFSHFGKHFFLEIQDHNHPIQIELNKKIKELHYEVGVPIIHGCDSHYIYTEDAKIRTRFLNAKGMNYGDEDSFILDYPDYDTIIARYQEQGILTKEEAEEALDNTLIFDKAEGIDLNFDFKLPHLSMVGNDSNAHLKKLILKCFKEKMQQGYIKKEDLPKYKKEINYEYNIIKKCNMADYFILDYYIVKQAVEKYGAVLTQTGRGSAVSYLTNYLLGFTQIDRLKSPIKLYPTRFMSAERILSTRSLPDIDLNWKDVKPVLKASKDYLGEDGVYYMVSYKPMQESSAFRLWCKSCGYNINEYNNIAMDLENYKQDPKWGKIIEDSKVFVGVIESVAPSPCSVLLLDKPISEEIGLLKVKDVTCCVLDGYNCDVFKYLKNDYLQVTVYSLIDETYKLIGRPIDDIETLIQNCDDKVWKLFENGITTTINQCDSDYDKTILKRYKPKNLAELSAYVASIRPGFISLLNTFVNREPYSTGVQQLDDLLQDSFSFMLYQETVMTYLTWLGIEEKETYDIIKKISKKKFKHDELEELKNKLKIGWIKQVGKIEGFNKTWQVVEDASRYSFNASHALSVALDALYGAYLKSHYPLEYFKVALTQYDDDEVRTNNLTNELEYFEIKLSPIKFRYSIDEYMIDKKTKTIYKSVTSVKYCNKKIAKELYNLKNKTYESFIGLLIDIKNKTSVNSRQLDILIKLDFFSEFGEINTLLKQVELFNQLKGRKSIKKDKLETYRLLEEDVRKCAENETEKQFSKLDWLKLLKLQLEHTSYPATTYKDKIKYEMEHLGYIETTEPKEKHNVYFIQNIKKTKKLSHIDLYEVYSGKTRNIKAWNKTIDSQPFDKGDFITIYSLESKVKKIPSNETNPQNEKAVWISDPSGEKEYWLTNKYSVHREEANNID